MYSVKNTSSSKGDVALLKINRKMRMYVNLVAVADILISLIQIVLQLHTPCCDVYHFKCKSLKDM